LDLYLDVLNVSLQQETYGFAYGTTDPKETGTVEHEREPIRIPIILPMLGLKATY
jgi:hypothetical protein